MRQSRLRRVFGGFMCVVALGAASYFGSSCGRLCDDSYGFSIMGVPITPENYQLLSDTSLFPQVLRGRMRYDPSGGRLVLDSVVLDGQVGDSTVVLDIFSRCRLELEVHGECRIASGRHSAMRVRGHMRVVGRSILTVESQQGAAIELVGGTLEVTDISYVDAWSGWRAITGCGVASSRLVVDGATVRAHVLPVRGGGEAEQGQAHAIGELGALECRQAGILDRGAVFAQGAVRSVATGEAARCAMVTPFLGFYIGGVAITYSNYGLLNDPFVLPSLRQGRVRYDPTAHALRLEDAYLASEEGGVGLYCQDANGLRLELVGENTIASAGGHALVVQDSVSIVGRAARLTCRARGGAGIKLSPDARLLVEDCELVARGAQGVAGRHGAALLLRDATFGAACDGLRGDSVGAGSVAVELDSLNLLRSRTALCHPRGGVFRPGVGVVLADGEPVRDSVQFAPAAMAQE